MISKAPAADMQPGAVTVVATLTVVRKAHLTTIWSVPVPLVDLAFAFLAALALPLLLM